MKIIENRGFLPVSAVARRKLGGEPEKDGPGGFGSGTRQSHFRNQIYEVLSLWYKNAYILRWLVVGVALRGHPSFTSLTVESNAQLPPD